MTSTSHEHRIPGRPGLQLYQALAEGLAVLAALGRGCAKRWRRIRASLSQVQPFCSHRSAMASLAAGYECMARDSERRGWLTVRDLQLEAAHRIRAASGVTSESEPHHCVGHDSVA